MGCQNDLTRVKEEVNRDSSSHGILFQSGKKHPGLNNPTQKEDGALVCYLLIIE